MRRPKQVQKPANTDLPHTRPRPGRRRHHNALLPLSFTYTFLLTLPMLLSLLCITTEASDQQSSPGRIVRQRFAERKILFDDKPPELYRRGDSTASLRAIAAPTATGSDSATISIISESTSTSSALPKAFDGGLGTNYTKPSCPTFLRSMVNDDTFISCVPFSLLLRNSMSFFAATRSRSDITNVLNASCSVPQPTCSDLMSGYALRLRSPSACSTDYDRQNPQVRHAYAGLVAYTPLYDASCITTTTVPPTTSNPRRREDNDNDNDNDNNYCFTTAITTTANPTDTYIYHLPLGTALPAGSRPSCNPCLRATMAGFAIAAGNRSQPLSAVYAASAATVNAICGDGFVNATAVSPSGESLARGSLTGSAAGRVVGWTGWVGVGVGVGIVLVLG